MRTTARIFLLVVLVLSCASPQKSWKELNSNTLMLYKQGRYPEAAKVAEEALTIAEETFGPNHPQVAAICENLAKLYVQIGKKKKLKS
jgi:hypothetical protein